MLCIQDTQRRLDSDSILAAGLRLAPLAAPFIDPTGETKDKLVNMLVIVFIMLLFTLLFGLIAFVME